MFSDQRNTGPATLAVAMRVLLAATALAMIAPPSAMAWEMTALPEFFRPDPFGSVVAIDRQEGAPADRAPATPRPCRA